MKRNLLLTASVLVLASCAGNNSQDVTLTETNLGVAGVLPETSYEIDSLNDDSASNASSYEGVGSSILDEKTLQLRQDLAAITDNTVIFDFDSSALNQDAQNELKIIAGFIMAQDNVGNVTIQGHCDERGTREYNLSLGERRAVAVKKYLVGLGLPSEKLETISFGKEQPEYTEHTSAAWSKNRRAVVLVEAAE